MPDAHDPRFAQSAPSSTTKTSQIPSYKTACGRHFDPETFQQMLHAVCDKKWMQAIYRGLNEDKEYMEMMKTEGGAAMTITNVLAKCSSDDHMHQYLHDLLVKDKKAALAMCSFTESYRRLIEKRDRESVKRVAAGSDPMADVRKQQGSFGSTMN